MFKESKVTYFFLLNALILPLNAVEVVSDLETMMSMSFEELLNVELQIGGRTGHKTVGTSNLPIDVITAEQLRRTGYGELPKALNHLLPSFTYVFASLDDLTDHVRPFSLNGMRSDQVMVLINGKRVHHSSVLFANDSQMRGATSVDLNLIPIESIQRVEVLRDDASAQYGSDAIAGVINIVLKSGPVNELVLLAGQRKEGDGELYSASYNYGTKDVFTSIEVKSKNHTNVSGLDQRDYYFPGDPRNGNYDVTHRMGDADHKNLTLSINAEHEIANDSTLYYFGRYVYKESESTGFFRRPQDDRNVRAIYPDGFLPEITPTQHDLFASIGYLYEKDDSSFELSNTLGYNHFQIGIDNSLNTSLGTNSPTSFDAGTTQYLQNTVNADFTQSFDLDLKHPLKLAYGAEYRYERYEITAGEEASWIDGQTTVLDGPNTGANTSGGAQVWPGFAPSNESSLDRHVLAIYAELGFYIIDDLEAKISIRDEEYSDFGNTFNAKGSLAYQARDDLGLRTSISSGYRAPSLQQMGYYRTSTDFFSGNLSENGTYPVDHEISKLLGAEDLDPETSLRASVGLSYHPLHNLEFSADFYVIDVKDQVGLTDLFTTSDPIPADALAYMTANEISGVNYMINAIDTRTKGLDLSVKYETQITSGDRLGLMAQYHHNETKIRDIHIPSTLNLPVEDVFSRGQQERRISQLPEDKAIFTADYAKGPVDILTRINYFGKTLNVADSSDPSLDQWFDARTTVDLDMTYRMTSNIDLSIGAHNVFDTYSEYRNSNPPFFGEGNILPYRAKAPFEYTGAFYYLRGVVRF